MSEPAEPGHLYSVALPIGNAGDISARAVEILSAVDVVACEDTRKMWDWAKRAGINTSARFVAHHAHNEKNSAPGLVKWLQEGKSIALVSDAGTPLVSDPGRLLMQLCYEHEIPVHPVPGAAALTALLSISPLPGQPLLFLGFLSPKKGRRNKTLAEYAGFRGTVALYESVHRIETLLEAIYEQWGDCDVLLAREITKKFEEFYHGKLKNAIAWVENKKGEFALLVHKGDMPD